MTVFTSSWTRSGEEGRNEVLSKSTGDDSPCVMHRDADMQISYQ